MNKQWLIQHNLLEYTPPPNGISLSFCGVQIDS